MFILFVLAPVTCVPDIKPWYVLDGQLWLWSITCHMGWHSVTCHPTQANIRCLYPSQSDWYL